MNFKEVVLSVVLALLLSGLCLCINQCSEAPMTPPRVVYEKIIEQHHDTLIKLDTILKYKIKKVESMPDTVVIKSLDTLYNRHLDSVETYRELLKCKDSLSICQTKVYLDTISLTKIDTLIPKTEKACSFKEQATTFGLGTLFGITLRSFF